MCRRGNQKEIEMNHLNNFDEDMNCKEETRSFVIKIELGSWQNFSFFSLVLCLSSAICCSARLSILSILIWKL